MTEVETKTARRRRSQLLGREVEEVKEVVFHCTPSPFFPSSFAALRERRRRKGREVQWKTTSFTSFTARSHRLAARSANSGGNHHDRRRWIGSQARAAKAATPRLGRTRPALPNRADQRHDARPAIRLGLVFSAGTAAAIVFRYTSLIDTGGRSENLASGTVGPHGLVLMQWDQIPKRGLPAVTAFSPGGSP